MKPLLLFFVIFVTTGLICISLSKVVKVVYYVSPTEQLSSCHGNSSCPPGQVCYMMDNLAEKSQKFFSSEHVNIILMFMCGVHNLTKNFTVLNLYSFAMKGETGIRENVIIDMLHQETVKPQFDKQPNKPNCTSIQFFNLSYVTITNLTMRCPSISVEGGLLSIKNSHLNGHNSIYKAFSLIYISGRSSKALLVNCEFKENCFVESNNSAGITVINTTFQSYRHLFKSMIGAHYTIITLTGNVNFTDGFLEKYGSSGAAVFMMDSSLNITVGSVVHFVNLTNDGLGGAVFLLNGGVDIGIQASVFFMNNNAYIDGGALNLDRGTLNVKPNASIYFINNSNSSPSGDGGAVSLKNANVTVGTNVSLLFFNNTAAYGGAMYFYFGALTINDHGVANFIMNSAQIQGGAIYIEVGELSISLKNTSKLEFHNNSAFQGGAIYITPSSFAIEVGVNSSIEFVNNTAADVGGAVYAEMQSAAPCLFIVTDYSAEISFISNIAHKHIGQHMYGTSVRDYRCLKLSHLGPVAHGKEYCADQDLVFNHNHINIFFYPNLSEILSPVSSAPMRVCLCDMNGRPQCANMSHIFTSTKVYRGETFTLSACVVGYDFGTTVGNVYSHFLLESSDQHALLKQSQYSQPVSDSEKCSTLTYTVYTNRRNELLHISTFLLPANVYSKVYKQKINLDIQLYYSDQFGCLKERLLNTPLFINISLLPGCPPGLTPRGDPPGCGCYSVLTNNHFQCSIQNKTGYLIWNTTMWVNATFDKHQSNGIINSPFCPVNYCKLSEKKVNLQDDPSEQCASNRDGILCGACKKNFSLAIGSSRCIECRNSSNLALLLFFAAGGVFLVFFILVFNLTVTQGLVNGVIFYANIVWAYKIILFPSEIQENSAFHFLYGFIAWLNLDFGIEACFFEGLNAYWKTWLQFLFPLYIWTIADVIIVACRYSSRLTKLIGSRAVPLLATLFLLSFMKLLRTIIDVTSVAVITQHPQNTSFAVWYLDGNLLYCQPPHIFLFIVAVGVLVFLWLPYTMVLLFIQPSRRLSHLKPFKWINRLAPVYDAYFYPLKDKHHYWFGVLLLVRGALLVVLTTTLTLSPELNVFILSMTMTFLVLFTSVKPVYKRNYVRILESATTMNLIFLSTGTLYLWESQASRTTLLNVSIWILFTHFCSIVLYRLIRPCYSAAYHRCQQTQQRQGYEIINENSENIIDERMEDPEPELLIVIARGTTKTATY